MFADLPSSIRTKFNNDPAQYLDFVQDPEKLEEMRELGLALADPEAEKEPETAIEEVDTVEKPTKSEKKDEA